MPMIFTQTDMLLSIEKNREKNILEDIGQLYCAQVGPSITKLTDFLKGNQTELFLVNSTGNIQYTPTISKYISSIFQSMCQK